MREEKTQKLREKGSPWEERGSGWGYAWSLGKEDQVPSGTGRGKEGVFPAALGGSTSLPTHGFWTSGFQFYEKINSYYFKTSNFW